MSRPLDLALRPFVNRRPVMRLAVLLWLAGGLLLAGNVWLYWDFLTGRGNVHARRQQVEREIEIEERRIAALSEQLAAFDLADQNEQVAYLNQRIDQRRFSWSRLFDELAELLPRDVRIQSLTPGGADGGSRARTRRAAEVVGDGKVLLRIQAEARSDEAILDLVDALFSDPDFERPNLLQQSADQGGWTRFDIEVIYHPPAPSEGPAGAEILPAGAEVAPSGGEPAGAPSLSPMKLGRPASAPPELP